jgi:argonaute-like protein implicated in RNA metabolism and viral defense
VLNDILSLTKVNFNSASYSDGLPVTIRFADKVGEVLVMGSAENAARQPFKYYI